MSETFDCREAVARLQDYLKPVSYKQLTLPTNSRV
jgi:hypothetical protein